MGMLRGSQAVPAFANLASIGLVCALWLVSTGQAKAADLTEVEPRGYTYFSIEGGYIHLDGNDVESYLVSSETNFPPLLPPRQRSLNVTDGYYGRAEIGHVGEEGLFNRIFNGIGAYVYGWDSSKDDISDTDFQTNLFYKHDGDFNLGIVSCSSDDQGCATGEGDLDRWLIEVGVKLFHTDIYSPSSGGLSIGIEPFVAFISEDTESTIGNTFDGPFVTRGSDLDATAYGALIAVDGRHNLLERTVLISRIAAGGYFMDADADTGIGLAVSDALEDRISSDFGGFRGQLAVGVEQLFTDAFSIGVIGRLDYWSDFPTLDWTDFQGAPGDTQDNASNNSIASADLLTLSVGLRVSLAFQ